MTDLVVKQQDIMKKLLDMMEIAYRVRSDDQHTTWAFPFSQEKIILNYQTGMFECDNLGYLSAIEALQSILEEKEQWKTLA